MPGKSWTISTSEEVYNMLKTLDGRRRGEYCERLDELILSESEVNAN